MVNLELQIEQAESYAELHAQKCSDIISANGLKEALEYCKKQGINPPQCSLTAQSLNADNQRAKAKRMLSEVKWWKRRLGVQAGQTFELKQIQSGKVTDCISNESLEHYKKKRRKRI
ncbi:hypothetical protein [Parashewanella tropica]|uniref:hypothetical protein n=1 Tax=Parashewanella tropica TaxID=2547970 RepID=UPI001059F275|nr:hypothetical protein [Parashewanella tropica]